MKFNKALRTLALTLVITLLSGFGISAAPIINDVSSSHWAYSAVVDILNRQLMSTDQNGNFRPGDSIDKFETVRIIARMLGYKYENATAEEASYYERVYQQRQSFLSQFNSGFVRWNTSTDKEIAFLMDKGVIAEEDLNQFVLRDQNGNESLRALSREDAAVFLTRAIGKKDEALSMSYSYDFLDDASINPAYKPYVYYFKSKQVVVGENGNYSPKSAVSRVAMAVMLSKVLQLVGGNVPATQTTPFYSQPTTAPNSYVTVSGTIDRYFPNMGGAVQVVTSDGVTNIYKVLASATVTINGVPSSVSMLQQGMTFSGTLNNNDFSEIRAQSTTVPVTPPPLTVQPTPAPETKIMEGIVSAVQSSDNGQQILIERNVVSPRGEITPEILTYTLSSGCTVLRGDLTVTFADIAKGEIVKLTVSGNTALNIALEEKNISFEGGTLIEKRFIEASNTPYYVVEDKNGKRYELKVTGSTAIKRSNFGDVSYDQLRLGDVVDVVAEYDKLISIFGYGVIATMDGTVEEIHISSSSSTISVMGSDNKVYKYTVIPGSVDIYSVKLRDRVRLRLDSLEVENISVLQMAETNFVTGFVQVVSTQSFSLQDISTTPGMTKTIYFDSSTVVVNSRTGEKVSLAYLRNGMKVYVNMSSTANAPAKTITILLD